MSLTGENVKIVVVGSGSIGKCVTAMIGAIDSMKVVERKAGEMTFNVHDFQRTLFPKKIMTFDKEHGHYRQFEKRDKRKNYR